MLGVHERSSTGVGRRDAGPAPTLRSRAARWFGRCFYACGVQGVPTRIHCLDDDYVLEAVFKHDFLAATALYRGTNARPDLPRSLVCKIGRQMHFCLIPLGWLGRLVTRIEVAHLRRCEGIPEVPRVLARPRPNVYVYEYIEGTSLGDKPALAGGFLRRAPGRRRGNSRSQRRSHGPA